MTQHAEILRLRGIILRLRREELDCRIEGHKALAGDAWTPEREEALTIEHNRETRRILAEGRET